MDKCLKDGQIPCRWVPDMGYGYGYPQFNYYSPLPYYVMEIFHLLGMEIVDTVKIGFILSLVLSTITMFVLGSWLWGRAGGLVSAVFYLYAPYRAMDIYNRGAMAEAWSFIFMPLIFYFSARVFKKTGWKNQLGLVLSLAGLFLSHNLTSMIFVPFWLLWGGYWWWVSNKKGFGDFSISVFLGFGLAAFFVIPALMERRFVHTETMLMGYFNYLAHFVSLRQIFFQTHWGFGSSILGPYDDVNFSLGINLWLVPLLTLFFIRRLNGKKQLLVCGLIFSSLIALFLTHQRSTFVWNRVGFLAYLQFPWRFLVLVVFFFSLTSGAFLNLVREKKKRLFLGVFWVLLAIGSCVFYFQPKAWFQMDDRTKFSGELWEKQLTISIFDYLPIFAKMPPTVKASEQPWAEMGTVKNEKYEKGSNWQRGKMKVISETAVVRLPVYYFPDWEVKVNNKPTKVDYQNYLGLITFEVPRGEVAWEARLKDTWFRKVGNSLSLLSWGGMIWLWRKKS
jgi:hypothetical protein